MTPRTASRLAWSLWLAFLAFVPPIAVLEVLARTPGTSAASDISLAIASAFVMTLGAIVVSRRPENQFGWVLCAFAYGMVAIGISSAYARYSAFRTGGPLFGGVVAAWVANWVWFPTLAILMTMLLQLFPTGRVADPRWRWLLRATVVGGLIGTAVIAVTPGRYDVDYGRVLNPFGVATLRGFLAPAADAFGAAWPAVILLLSVASLVVRYGRAGQEERHQLKWFLFAALLMILWLVPTASTNVSGWPADLLFSLAILLVPAAAAIAIRKYRLYDIDVVINKAVVYGALAAFITAVYVAIVVGVGALIGRGSRPNLGLSILATALVAVGFQAVRERAQRLANRLVYGKRSTPYEVLSDFSDRIAATLAADELLPRMAATLASGTGAAWTRVWLARGGELRVVSQWPEGTAPPSPMPLPGHEGGRLPGELDDGILSLPVRHGSEVLGAITLGKAAGDRMTPTEEQLARDLASQAGLVLHNVRLGEELRTRVEELRASRRRLVAAQDSARRRLERNIHDGAQQQLVALSVKTNLARQLVTKNPSRAEELVLALRGDIGRALDDLGELALGVVPASLQELGLAGALRAQAERAALPVTIRTPSDLPPLSEETQTAVYFCVLEALQNVAKYAGAAKAIVDLAVVEDHLMFSVADDGRGFDSATTGYGTGLKGMADRLGTLGGTVEVRSSPGKGTTVQGRIPVPALEPVR